MTADNPHADDADRMVNELKDALSSESPAAEQIDGSQTGDESSTATIKANKKVKTPRRGGGLISWLALLLALAAAAMSAFTYWQQHQLSQSANDNMTVVENTASDLKRDLQTDLQSRLNSFSSESDKLMNELSQSNSRLERKLRADFSELGERVSENEQQVVTLKGFSDAAKYAYVKAEIEYFLQTANNRIQLVQDAGSAQAALEAADERLNILRDPSLAHVRAQVRDEIQALKAIEQPDIEGLALTLASLSKQVPGLPMRMDDEEDYYQEEIELKEGTGFRVGMSNVWRNMRGTLDKLVEVRDATPSDVPLLSVEDVRLVYANLDIQLQSARLASLKGDAKNYQVSIDGASQLLSVYFDSEKKQVQAMLDTLAEIKSVELSPKLPDISGSLKLLRELRSAEKASSTNTISEDPVQN
jgi:uroporphyrin-3 C-methyltransferase